MKDYFEVICGADYYSDVFSWYEGNDFREAVATVDKIRGYDPKAVILFLYNGKEILLK